MGAAVGDGLAEGDGLEDRAIHQPPAPAAQTTSWCAVFQHTTSGQTYQLLGRLLG